MTAGNDGRFVLAHWALRAGKAALVCSLLAACGEDPVAPRGADPSISPPVIMGQAGSAGVGGITQPPLGGGGGQAGAAMMPQAGGPPNTGGAGAGAGGVGGVAVGRGGIGGGGMSGAGAGAGGSVPPGPPGEICTRWKADRVNLTEPAWNGDAAACMAGDLSPETRETALRLVNLYRFMAGLEPVAMTDEGNRLAQGCALLMAANGTITHTPPASWKCYTEEGKDTAGKSSLSSGGSISSVDGYMLDPGNPTTIGHRRWILSNMLSSIGFGSAGRFSCQYQPARRPPAGAKAWVAWPSPGQVPIQAMGSRFAKVDQTGWTVQSDTINLGTATVTVSSNGMDLPVTVTKLDPGYGSSFAIRFNPMGWSATAGQTYKVKLAGTSMPIEYDVEIVDCP